MPAHGPEIDNLRALLQTSRSQLQDGIQNLERQLNVPRRIRTKLAEHPVRWVAVSVAVGLVAAKVVPGLVRGTGKTSMRTLLPVALRAGALIAMPLLARWSAKSRSGFTPWRAAHASHSFDHYE